MTNFNGPAATYERRLKALELATSSLPAQHQWDDEDIIARANHFLAWLEDER